MVLVLHVADYLQEYDGDHAEIDLLRLRNYTIGRKLADTEVIGESGRERVAQLLTALQPFVSDSAVLKTGRSRH